MIQCSQVSVTTAATKLCDVPAGFQVTIMNGATVIAIGTTNAVTTGTGAPLAVNGVLPPIVAGEDGATLWAIVAAGTSVVGIILSRRT